jgi:hypothetical protein
VGESLSHTLDDIVVRIADRVPNLSGPLISLVDDRPSINDVDDAKRSRTWLSTSIKRQDEHGDVERCGLPRSSRKIEDTRPSMAGDLPHKAFLPGKRVVTASFASVHGPKERCELVHIERRMPAHREASGLKRPSPM